MLVNKTKDIKLINKLDQECFDDFYSLELLQNLNEKHTFYIFEKDNEIIGFAIFNNVDQGEYELIKIGILKQYRYKGYANQAMDIILNKIKWSKIFLEVDEKNHSAIKLYTRLGFNFINKRKQYYKNGNDALIFLKEK